MGEIQRGLALARSKRTEPPMARKRMLSAVAVGRVQARRPMASSERTSPVNGSNLRLAFCHQGPLMA